MNWMNTPESYVKSSNTLCCPVFELYPLGQIFPKFSRCSTEFLTATKTNKSQLKFWHILIHEIT